MNGITRRELLQMGARSLGVIAAGGCLGRFSRLYAAVPETADYRALVCIFLLGGNDGNNLVVPIKTDKQNYSDYFRVRGKIAGLSQNSLGVIATANGKEMYGLHPRLEPLRDLYGRGKMAIVANVGTLVRPISKGEYHQGAPVPLNLFSHSDQQQQWQMASIPGAPHNGWAGRAADLVTIGSAPAKFPIGVSTAGNSLFLTGETPEVSIING